MYLYILLDLDLHVTSTLSLSLLPAASLLRCWHPFPAFPDFFARFLYIVLYVHRRTTIFWDSKSAMMADHHREMQDCTEWTLASLDLAHPISCTTLSLAREWRESPISGWHRVVPIWFPVFEAKTVLVSYKFKVGKFSSCHCGDDEIRDLQPSRIHDPTL